MFVPFAEVLFLTCPNNSIVRSWSILGKEYLWSHNMIVCIYVCLYPCFLCYIPCNNLGKWRLKAFCYVHIPQANWSARIIRSIKWYGIDSQSSIKVLTQVHLGQICSFFSCIYYKTWKKKKKTVIFVLQHLSRKEKVCIWCH